MKQLLYTIVLSLILVSCTGGGPTPKFISIEGDWTFTHNTMIADFTIEKTGNQMVVTKGGYSVRSSKDGQLHPFIIATSYTIDGTAIQLLEKDKGYMMKMDIASIPDGYNNILVKNIESNSLRNEIPIIFDVVTIYRTPQ